ncbi:MAG: hypothetical protein ACE5LV_02065 [Candidatus Aminicenantales bacterium]
MKQVEDVKNAVKKARPIIGAAETLFPGESDNPVHQDLPEIIGFIRKIFPEARRITAYVRANSILRAGHSSS